MKNLFSIFIVICCLAIISSCNRESGSVAHQEGDVSIIDMSNEKGYYDSIFNSLSKPRLVVLKENDSIMFADISRLIAKDNYFFILDGDCSRTVVSFTQDGTPVAKYGRLGQGPGEYVRPWDIAIKDSTVFILDSNLKKLISYDLHGKFIGERSIPFVASSFVVIDNDNIVFSLYPDGEGNPQLCLTDSTLNIRHKFISSKKGYVGGWGTPNTFRQSGDGIFYYRAPLDTMFIFNNKADLTGCMVFDFGNKSVPEDAKLDFISVSEDGQMKDAWMLADTPIPVAGGLFVGIIVEDNKQYSAIIDPERNRMGVKAFDECTSVYDIMEPCAADEDGNLIGYTSLEYIEDKKDFDGLDEAIKAELRNNNRLLVIYPFSGRK